MLPIKDAPRPSTGQSDTPSARAADTPRPGGSAPAPGTGGQPVASQRPSQGHAGHHQGHGHSHGPSHGGGQPRRDSGREGKAAGSPNSQDVFLNYARREKLTVVIQLLDGQSVEGRIKNFDKFAVIVEVGGADQLIFKHAISTIETARSIPNYFSSHHS